MVKRTMTPVSDVPPAGSGAQGGPRSEQWVKIAEHARAHPGVRFDIGPIDKSYASRINKGTMPAFAPPGSFTCVTRRAALEDQSMPAHYAQGYLTYVAQPKGQPSSQDKGRRSKAGKA